MSAALRKRRKRRAARGNETTHTHTQRERERCREKKEPPSLSLIREETKKHSINYPPSSGPNSLRENRSETSGALVPEHQQKPPRKRTANNNAIDE